VTDLHVEQDRVLVHPTSGLVQAAHVVLALPPALALASITITPDLPEQVRALAASTAVWMGGIVKAVAVYDQAFWRDAGLAGSAVSHVGPYRELHDHSGPGGTPAAIFGFATADRFSATDPADAFREQLRRLFGRQAGEPLHLHVADWSRERWTSPAAPSARATTDTYGHPRWREPIHGRLHLASTETATEYAGHIEGAVRAGRAVAETVLRSANPEV
jgi:monoamine oxidase